MATTVEAEAVAAVITTPPALVIESASPDPGCSSDNLCFLVSRCSQISLSFLIPLSRSRVAVPSEQISPFSRISLAPHSTPTPFPCPHPSTPPSLPHTLPFLSISLPHFPFHPDPLAPDSIHSSQYRPYPPHFEGFHTFHHMYMLLTSPKLTPLWARIAFLSSKPPDEINTPPPPPPISLSVIPDSSNSLKH